MAGSKIFEWSRLGDLEAGRGTLGLQMPVSVYRLMQYTILDELEDRFGADDAIDIFRKAGFRAGQAFAKNVLDLSLDFNSFTAQLQKALHDMKIGILQFEKTDLEALDFILTVDEDLDCSGLPIYGDTVCFYDEGFISAILTLYTGRQMNAVEIDCWATGARTCRFKVGIQE
jgi:predicted hydrocarbon binding protein